MTQKKETHPNRYLINTRLRWTSLLKKLRSERKIDDNFEAILNSLSLEDIIALKLELSSKTAGSPLYGLPIWHGLNDIVKDAVLKFAISTTQTSSEAARFLGLDQGQLVPLIKKFRIYDYFGRIAFKEKHKK
jgi:hypothetical protein